MQTTLAHRAARCRAVLPESIVARTFVAETVLLDVTTGRYFKLDRTAGAMLDALLANRSLSTAATALAGPAWGSEDALIADLAELCAELEGLGLLRLEAVR
jgi:hypothetical protein